jgi:hypothetical protein
VKAHGHAVDQEDEVERGIEHRQRGMLADLGRALQSVAGESVYASKPLHPG